MGCSMIDWLAGKGKREAIQCELCVIKYWGYGARGWMRWDGLLDDRLVGGGGEKGMALHVAFALSNATQQTL